MMSLERAAEGPDSSSWLPECVLCCQVALVPTLCSLVYEPCCSKCTPDQQHQHHMDT